MTDGVSLFAEELTITILASDILNQNEESYRLTRSLIAPSIRVILQESLMAVLDRLPKVREVSQIGSVLLSEFAYEIISGSSPIDDELQEQSFT